MLGQPWDTGSSLKSHGVWLPQQRLFCFAFWTQSLPPGVLSQGSQQVLDGYDGGRACFNQYSLLCSRCPILAGPLLQGPCQVVSFSLLVGWGLHQDISCVSGRQVHLGLFLCPAGRTGKAWTGGSTELILSGCPLVHYWIVVTQLEIIWGKNRNDCEPEFQKVHLT